MEKPFGKKEGKYMKKWYLCPYCKKKLVKYKENANADGIFLLCKNCKEEIEIKIINKKLGL